MQIEMPDGEYFYNIAHSYINGFGVGKIDLYSKV